TVTRCPMATSRGSRGCGDWPSADATDPVRRGLRCRAATVVRRIVVGRDARTGALRREVGPTGIKVIDKGKVHQDHAVAVRGVVAMLLDRPSAEGPQGANLAPRPFQPTDWEHLGRLDGIDTSPGAIGREFGDKRED